MELRKRVDHAVNTSICVYSVEQLASRKRVDHAVNTSIYIYSVEHNVNTKICGTCCQHQSMYSVEHMTSLNVWSMPSTPVNVYSVEHNGITKTCGSCRQHQYMCIQCRATGITKRVDHAVNTSKCVQCRANWHHENEWSIPSTPVYVYSVEHSGITKTCGSCR